MTPASPRERSTQAGRSSLPVVARARDRLRRMRLAAVCAVLVALGFAAVAPAQAYDERPMRLPGAGPRAAGAPSQPAAWLVAAEPGGPHAAAIARRFGARRLRVGAVYRVATGRARAFAAALRGVRALRYAEPDVPLRRASAFDAQPSGYARGVIVDPGLLPPAPGAASVAVVDDRVDVTHPDLVASTRQLNPGPVLGDHGTAVASAAAGAFNGFGVVGIFPSAPVLSVGVSPELECAEASDGILAAADAGARVINLSFGTPEHCATLFAAVQIAYGRGSLVVASAGNEFAAGNPVIFPAAYPHVLSVAALDRSLKAADFSSENVAVDVAAPGVDVPVAIPVAFDTQDGRADAIATASGTSFSAPMVSGAAAWLATTRPGLSNGQLADVLRQSARDVGPPGYDASTGFGLIQMRAALASATPASDVFEPNDGISFVDGSVFAKPDPYVWRGGRRRTLRASADEVEDPIDVYRIRLRKRSRARIRLLPSFGNPDLYVFRSSARSIRDRSKIIARSKKRGTRRTDSVRITNAKRSARRLYVMIRLGRSSRLDVSYRLKLQRIKRR